jgi:hypothetical protein
MRDGLYRLRFQSARGWGSGVMHTIGGRVWGGDGVIFYTGTVTETDGRVELIVTTEPHTENSSLETIFGVYKARLVLSGPAGDDVMHLDGSPDDAPGLLIRTELTWLTG